MPTYMYAVTAADHPLRLDDLAGVGETPAPLRTLGTGTLSAVVSDAPEGLRAKRRDLVAHQAVLERLMTDGSALPMRFGLIGPDDDQVLAVLADHRDTYLAQLAEIDGCVEYNLKASREEEDLLHEIVTGSAEVRRLREATREAPAAQTEKMRLGELVAHEVQTREDRERAELTALLAGDAVRHTVAEPPRDHFLNVSFLVRRGDATAFAQQVQQESERRGDAYSLRLHGPLPPYSFV